MSTVLETVLLTTVTLGAVAFFAYWTGVRHEQSKTRKWARRALNSERFNAILIDANSELKRDLINMEDGRPLTGRETRQFERIIREAGE